MKTLLLAVSMFALPALAQHAPQPPQPPPAPDAPMPPPPPAFFHGAPGIPPQVAQKLGIPQETVKKVQQLGFDSQDQLINLEADLKRAQLDLERTLAGTNPDESQVMLKLEQVSKAELQVKKNRVGLMLKIRKQLGPDLWEKVQAELPMMDISAGPGFRHHEVRVIKNGDSKTIESHDFP
ncbi:MAG: periplasmic heavy metal sensor [Myxococcaceae bacterium]